MGAKGRVLAEATYSEEVIAEATVAAYARLLGRAPARRDALDSARPDFVRSPAQAAPPTADVRA
jgi:hypothetical protein